MKKQSTYEQFMEQQDKNLSKAKLAQTPGYRPEAGYMDNIDSMIEAYTHKVKTPSRPTTPE